MPVTERISTTVLNVNVVGRRARIGLTLLFLATAIVGVPTVNATGLREIPTREEPLVPLEPPDKDYRGPGADPTPVFRVAVVTRDTADSPLRRGAVSAAGDQVEIVEGSFEAENALDLQINLVENAITAGVDGIILDPLHQDGLVPYVERARTAGIVVVTVNNPVATALVNTHVSTDQGAAGIAVVDRLLHLMGSDAVVGVLGSRPTGVPADERREGFLYRLRERYPKVRVVEPVIGGVSTEQEAMIATLDMITANRDIGGILATDAISTAGAARAVTRAGLAGEIALVGFDPGPDGARLLREGAVRGFLVEDHYGIGHTALIHVVEILRGGTVPSKVVVPYRFMTDRAEAGGHYSR